MLVSKNKFDSNAETLIFKGKHTLVSRFRFLHERVD